MGGYSLTFPPTNIWSIHTAVLEPVRQGGVLASFCRTTYLETIRVEMGRENGPFLNLSTILHQSFEKQEINCNSMYISPCYALY